MSPSRWHFLNYRTISMGSTSANNSSKSSFSVVVNGTTFTLQTRRSSIQSTLMLWPTTSVFYDANCTTMRVSPALRLQAAQVEADEQLQACRDIMGMGTEGWVPLEEYDGIKGRERQSRADTIEAAETEEERRALDAHWMFDDVDEEGRWCGIVDSLLQSD